MEKYIRVTEYNIDKEFEKHAVVNVRCENADYRIYISEDDDSITVTKIGKHDDQISVLPVVGNKIIIQ